MNAFCAGYWATRGWENHSEQEFPGQESEYREGCREAEEYLAALDQDGGEILEDE